MHKTDNKKRKRRKGDRGGREIKSREGKEIREGEIKVGMEMN